LNPVSEFDENDVEQIWNRLKTSSTEATKKELKLKRMNFGHLGLIMK
jgi:hypothetical protein